MRGGPAARSPIVESGQPMSTDKPTRRALPALLLVLLVMGGCGRPINVAALTPEDVRRLQANAEQVEQAYRIEPGDTLHLRYPFHPEMDQEVVVQADGKIMALGVGPLVVSGLSTAELQELLKEKTSHRLRNPEVAVTIRRYGDKAVYVGGEVGRPGVLVYRKGLTPLQAIIAAGGFRETARVDSVILVRPAEQDGQFMARKLDLGQVTTEGVEEPVTLAPDDILFVPRTPVANAGLWVRQHIVELFPLIRGTSLPSIPAGQ